MSAKFTGNDWALTETPAACRTQVQITEEDHWVGNGDIDNRKYIWEVFRKNYYDYGIDAFWLDNSEPYYGVYDFENYRYSEGPALAVSNIYPQMYSRTFYDGMNLGERKK